jgi:D-threonine aldolase
MSDWYEIANADEIASPSLLIYPDRIESNLKRMIELCGDALKLRPHVKTHKMPQIIEMKQRLGIRKFKVSTIAEAEMTASAGGEDVLIAYPLVGPNIARMIQLIQRFPSTRFSALIDAQAMIPQIAGAAVQNNVTIELYVDLNVGMNRTGITPGPQAFALYQMICRTAGLHAGGLHAYDGHLHDPNTEQLQHLAHQTFATVQSLRNDLIKHGFVVPRIITGGTPTSRLLAQTPGVEVGAGTIALWDFGQAEVSPDLDMQYAAILLSRVISRPSPDRICLDTGHKAVASEMSPPRVRWFGLEDSVAVMHSEEHMVLETTRADDWPVGRVVYGVPRHVCPTVALHSDVWCVRDGRAIERWRVVARDRCITI